MYSKYPFPISMENLPRQRTFCCLSLKFGCLFTALIVILYSLLGLAQCGSVLGFMTELKTQDHEAMMHFSIILVAAFNHAVTFCLSAVMLVGALREKYQLMRPWVIWSSIQVIGFLMMFIFYSATSTINGFSDTSLIVYVFEFMTLMIRIYMLILVASYYRQLEEEKDESERLKKLIDKDIWYSSA